ncbi:tyrosine-type recombinase/integrase [Serratia ureilytica]|uniref:Tyrosine-type recombinase/integrase n=1 Tax=Serratia ureilytica TaxID=300181 RepID=A0A9X9BXD5_9GAMM|nr:tyrosine-type recombinase/integrase [Serratia ureilytica]TXE22193.1 tyrosine-type recombinase/integrase [Serratia ureilytica]
MTKLTDTGRPGKKRYRVTWQGVGGSRTSEFANASDAYREYYRRERRLWEDGAESVVERKRRMTMKELMMFYFGRLCDDHELGEIGLSYFRGKRGVFEHLLDRWRRDSPAITDMDAGDFDDITVHNHRVFIRQAYKLAMVVGICRRNPCRLKNRHRKAAWKGVTQKYATHEEVRRMVSNPAPYRKFAAYVGATCGLRRGEIAALRWDNVQEHVLTVDSHLTGNGIEPGLKYGVDNALPIAPEFHRMLAEVPRGKSRYIFESSRGTHFSESGFYRAVVQPVFSEAGVNKGFHSLRHYAVSVWVGRGVSVVQISQWLDHASPEVTLRTYAHLFSRTDGRCFLFSET